MKWSRPDAALFEAWRGRARESILEVNDGIVAAAGIAEGFASVGASLRTLLFAGTSVTLAGGLAAAGARYSEVRTEWEMNRALIEAERASILADPEGELAELAEIYEAKGLDAQLAQLTFLIVLVALGLTGWFAAWLTDLPAIRLVRRNVLLGAATMVIGVLIGKAVGL